MIRLPVLFIQLKGGSMQIAAAFRLFRRSRKLRFLRPIARYDHTYIALCHSDESKDDVYFVKLSQDPERCARLQTQHFFDGFVNHSLSIVSCLEGDLYLDDEYCALLYPEFDGSFFMQPGDCRLSTPLIHDDLFKICLFLKFLSQVNHHSFISFHEKFPYCDRDYYFVRLEAHANTLGDQFKQTLLEPFLIVPTMAESVCHHDLAPWNLGKRKNGEIVLIDAEYSRWGMKWYDVVYFFIQLYTVAGEKKLALKFLEMVKSIVLDGYFGFESAHQFSQAFAYRIAVNLIEYDHETDAYQRSLELFLLFKKEGMGAFIS